MAVVSWSSLSGLSRMGSAVASILMRGRSRSSVLSALDETDPLAIYALSRIDRIFEWTHSWLKAGAHSLGRRCAHSASAATSAKSLGLPAASLF